MKTEINLIDAAQLQTLTEQFINQNNNIDSAIRFLRQITHNPNGQIKASNTNEVYGMSADDMVRIAEFIKFLDEKKMPMLQVFNFIINENHE